MQVAIEHHRQPVNLPPEVVVFERGWLSANNVLFLGEDKNILVDTGYWTHSSQTVALVEHALGPGELTAIVNTHLHSDHCGGNSALKLRYLEAKICIPPGLADAVQSWDTETLTYAPTGQHCPQFAFDVLLRPGKTIRLGHKDWEIHAAPGHDPDSVIFFEPESGTLISADAFWENGFGVVFPELEGNDAFSKVASTLELIERLEPTTVIPGHGPVFRYTPKAMANAWRRLDGFQNDPVRHARHASKVLIKFKLLELQRASTESLLNWAANTAYFGVIHARFFNNLDSTTWLIDLCRELVDAGAALFEGDQIVNV